MKKMLHYVHFYLPPLLWALFIFILSSRQRVSVTSNVWFDFAIFKSLHMIEYGTLFVLLYRAILNTSSLPRINAGIVSIILTILYAVSDEIHQQFVPTREGKLRDVGFDTIGALFFWYFLWMVLPKLPKRLKRWAKNWHLL